MLSSRLNSCPLKETDYRITTHNTGIADLKYRQKGTSYIIKKRSYPGVNEGDERYYGTYNIARCCVD